MRCKTCELLRTDVSLSGADVRPARPDPVINGAICTAIIAPNKKYSTLCVWAPSVRLAVASAYENKLKKKNEKGVR